MVDIRKEIPERSIQIETPENYHRDDIKRMKLFTIGEVAEILGVSIRTVRRYIKSGVIHPIQLGQAYRFSMEEIHRFMESRAIRN